MAGKKLKNELYNDYKLVGIATSLKEYTICYHLNNLLGCDFKKLDPLVFEPKDRSRKIQFSVLKAEEEEGSIYFVFTNKNMGEFLLPEVSHFDYIIKAMGKYTAEPLQHMVDGIKQFPEVVMSAEIPLKKIKSRERLVYEEEKPAAKRYRVLKN